MSDSDIAIRIEGLGKKYTLGETHQFTRNFRETLMTLPRHFGRKAARGILGTGDSLRRSAKSSLSPKSDHSQPTHESRGLATFSGSMEKVPCPRNSQDYSQPTHGKEEFWALRDINLEIKRGEAVGIIGRNGAGKSTLLKVLSRITAPTTGRAEIRGRVGALLEVGTGMNPELTGRENIYLNGAIIGMRKREIDAKFDEIVDFSGVEKFLDTPLKRYSSGMRVRLGFAVAAHLEPEILIVDEVLSVGDAEFRKKCLGKMDDVTGQGRTVLFVSHNMAAIGTFCRRTVILGDGRIYYCGDTDSALSRYRAITENREFDSIIQPNRDVWRSHPKIAMTDIRASAAGNANVLKTGDTLEIHLDFSVYAKLVHLGFSVSFRGPNQEKIFHAATKLDQDYRPISTDRNISTTLIIEEFPLTCGIYEINILVHSMNSEVLIDIANAASLSVSQSDYYKTGIPLHQQNCLIVAKHKWAVTQR